MSTKNLDKHGGIDDLAESLLQHRDRVVDCGYAGHSIPINPDLVWDYDIPSEAKQSEEFRRWYIARVLTRGCAEDLKAIGFNTIYAYLPTLNLPGEIRHFWEWYFNLPEVRQHYGSTYPTPT